MLAYKLRSLKTLQWPAQGINRVATTFSVGRTTRAGTSLGLLLLLLRLLLLEERVSQGRRDACRPRPRRGGCPPALPVHASVGILHVVLWAQSPRVWPGMAAEAVHLPVVAAGNWKGDESPLSRLRDSKRSKIEQCRCPLSQVGRTGSFPWWKVIPCLP